MIADNGSTDIDALRAIGESYGAVVVSSGATAATAGASTPR